MDNSFLFLFLSNKRLFEKWNRKRRIFFPSHVKRSFASFPEKRKTKKCDWCFFFFFPLSPSSENECMLIKAVFQEKTETWSLLIPERQKVDHLKIRDEMLNLLRDAEEAGKLRIREIRWLFLGQRKNDCKLLGKWEGGGWIIWSLGTKARQPWPCIPPCFAGNFL